MNRYGLVFTLVALSWKASAFANFITPPLETDTFSDPVVQEWPSNFEIGGDYTRVHLHPKGSSSFHGNLGGVQGLYEYTPKNDFYGAAKLAWKQGDTHGSAGKRSLLYIDTQERFGYSVGSQEKGWITSFFSGFGFRYLQQKLRPKTGSSLKFKYDEFYVPVGFKTKGDVNSWFALGTTFIWMPQVFPTVSIVPLTGTHWSLTNKLNNYFVELIFDFALTSNKRFHISVNPFYERWQDGHSKAKVGALKLGLPGNTYDFWGVDVNFSYRF